MDSWDLSGDDIVYINFLLGFGVHSDGAYISISICPFAEWEELIVIEKNNLQLGCPCITMRWYVILFTSPSSPVLLTPDDTLLTVSGFCLYIC